MSTIISYTGNTFATDFKVAIVASEFNLQIVDKLLLDAKKTLLAQQIGTITIVRVPGAFELPYAARQVAPEHDVVIALGAVIRGETPHFDFVSQACIEGLNRVIHDTNTPVVLGVLTTDTYKQAQARANGTAHDDHIENHQPQGSGVNAAIVALRMASLARQLHEGKLPQ